MRIQLHIRTPKGGLRNFEHRGPVVRIGRDPQCELAFTEINDNVSWHHAVIQLTATGAYLTDTQSTNGTFMGGPDGKSVGWSRIVEPTRLNVGDRSKLGHEGPDITVVAIDLVDEAITTRPASAPKLVRRIETPIGPRRAGSRATWEKPSGDSPASTSTRAIVVQMQKRHNRHWVLSVGIVIALRGVTATAVLLQQHKLVQIKGEAQKLAQNADIIDKRTMKTDKEVGRVLGMATKAEAYATDAQRKAADATTEARKAADESGRHRELFNRAVREISANYTDLAERMDKLATTPPSATQMSTPAAVSDDSWVIDEPQNVVWRAQWGDRYRGQLRHLSPTGMRIQPLRATIEVSHPAEKVHTVWLFDDVISYNPRRKRLESRFTYYAFDDPPAKATLIPSKNRKSFATSTWPGIVFRSSGQRSYAVLCHLHTGRIGLGLFDEVAVAIQAREIRHILTNHGIYVYDSSTDSLLAKSIEELRKEGEERAFSALMAGLEVLKNGFEMGTEIARARQEIERSK